METNQENVFYAKSGSKGGLIGLIAACIIILFAPIGFLEMDIDTVKPIAFGALGGIIAGIIQLIKMSKFKKTPLLSFNDNSVDYYKGSGKVQNISSDKIGKIEDQKRFILIETTQGGRKIKIPKLLIKPEDAEAVNSQFNKLKPQVAE